MDRMVEDLQRYLLANLGIEVAVRPFPGAVNYPAYLRDGYRFFSMKWLQWTCLLMACQKDAVLTPAVIAKQLEQRDEEFDSARFPTTHAGPDLAARVLAREVHHRFLNGS